MTMRARLGRLLRAASACGRLMVGVPDYGTYLRHVRERHPDTIPMSEADFLRNRQAARFGGGGRGGFRCC